MKKTILTIIFICVCVITTFSAAITKSGTLSNLYFYNSATAEVVVTVDGQQYFIDNTCPAHKTIIATLLLAKSTGARVEIMGDSNIPWAGSSTTYRIFRISILD